MTDTGINLEHENNTEKNSLAEFLLVRHYYQVPLGKLATGHLVIGASVNDVPGTFIVDSGASTTVVDEKNIELFKLNAVVDAETGAGAGGSGLTVYASSGNRLSINEFHVFPFNIAAMNFEHVNIGLQQVGVSEMIHGVIGADLLDETKAVIDYAGRHLYLKMKQEDMP